MTVVQMKDVIPAMTDLPAAGAANQAKGNGFSQSFDSASQNLKGANGTQNSGPDKMNRSGDVNAAKDAGNAMKKARRTDNRKDELGTGVNSEENLKQFEETAQVMVEKVAEVTDTSPEEVTEALESLGLGEDALFTSEGLGMVLTELNGVEDPILVVTDPELSAQFTVLTETADELLTELQSDLGLSDADMAELMKSFGEEATEITPAIETAAEPTVMQEEPVVTTRETGREEVKPTKEGETDIPVNASVKSEEAETPVVRKETNRHESRSGNETGKQSEGTISQPVFMKETGEVFFQTEGLSEADVPRMSAQDIYQQIGDYLKTISSENMESVEMQLHPESLGTLQIRVTSRGGNITASLVAQNEAVRAALETQVVALKQNFEEQGLKVDAVEVTVSTHQFESAMEQGNQSTGSEQGEAKRPTTRSLNLNEDFDEEELTEEEQIAVEMMEANGNTVDYKA